MAARTVNQGGGPAPDYSSLNAAVDDSIAADTIEIQGTWSADDTTQVVWNVAVSQVFADADSKQIGKPWASGSTAYRHRVTSGHAFIVTADIPDFRDINIQSNSSGVSDELFRAAGSSSGAFTNCPLGFTGNTDQQDIWYTEDNSTKTVTFEQCFFYDVGRSVVDAITGGDSGTFTIEFNSCGSFNIGANGGRSDGAWVGLNTTNSGDTIVVNAHNSLCHGLTNFIFASGASQPTFTVSATFCITNESEANFIIGEDGTPDIAGSVYLHTWVTSPGVGDEVGLTSITSGSYDPALVDSVNNDAQEFHSTRTDAGLTIPLLDILGQTRNVTGDANTLDVGPSALTLAAAAAGGLVAHSPVKRMAYLLNR